MMPFAGWFKTAALPEEPPEPTYDPALEPPPLGDRIRRGEAAVRLLGDPTLAEAFAEIEAEAHAIFADSKRDEVAKREDAYRIIQAVRLVRGKLIHYRDAARMRQEAA